MLTSNLNPPQQITNPPQQIANLEVVHITGGPDNLLAIRNLKDLYGNVTRFVFKAKYRG